MTLKARGSRKDEDETLEAEATNWKNYELVATFLLDQIAVKLGLERVEGAQKLVGATTTWTVDAKGVMANGDCFVIVECRRYTTAKLDQEAMGGFAYRIRDTGAQGGIIVSPLGLQEGGARIAAAEGIRAVQLNANSTTTNYILEFLGNVRVSVPPATASVRMADDGGLIVTTGGREYLIPAETVADHNRNHANNGSCLACVLLKGCDNVE